VPLLSCSSFNSFTGKLDFPLNKKKKRKINDDITITPFQDVILVLTRMKKRQKTTKSFKGACGLWLGVLNDYNGHESSELY
jgi:hypothetical protein